MTQLERDDENASFASVNNSSGESVTASTRGHHEGDEMHPTQKDQVKEVQDMAKWETHIMRFWKVVVCITILAIATVVSSGTWIFLKGEEDDNFKDSYATVTDTIRNSVRAHKRDLFLTMRTCSDSITGAAIATNSTFPFVTVPTFEIFGHSVRQQSGAELIIVTPKVQFDELTRWEEFAIANEGWYEESKKLSILSDREYVSGDIPTFVYDASVEATIGNLTPTPIENGPFYPMWQLSPPPFTPFPLKADLKTFADFGEFLKTVDIVREGVFSQAYDTRAGLGDATLNEVDHLAFHTQFVTSEKEESNAFERPHAFFFQPIFREAYNDSSDIVGTVDALVPWDHYFANLLPEGVKGITGVLGNTCGRSFTYYLNGNKAIYAGEGDMHEERYNPMKVVIPFSDYTRNSTKDVSGHCVYTFTVYPTKEFENKYHSNLPVLITSVVASAFCLMILTILAYDRFVQRRNQMVVGAAARANAILSTLFPKNIRDRLFEDKQMEEDKLASQKKALLDVPGNKARLSHFLIDASDRNEEERDADDDDFMYTTKPIADLFPDTTIMFADISGFTAWSSTREPSQVFILLETIYKAFDDIAKHRGVFKVETVGDCYVAVAGLPNPRKDHAVAMARFARECMHRVHQLTQKLEEVLGPDTADLSMRFGLHSGPVTAGVLRGERSRFQLFGDTMNTASRMESTGLRDKIQVSQDTADLLIAAGKSKWVEAREEKVVAKGKGEMQTYWVAVGSSKNKSSDGETSSTVDLDEQGNHLTDLQGNQEIIHVACAKTARLVKWNVDVLGNLLKQVHARRGGTTFAPLEENTNATSGETVLEEVTEIIHLPTFSGQTENPDDVVLDSIVLDQLEDYVSAVASMYRYNPFHNFEHASHVVVSVVKLLSRIVAPDIGEETGKDIASALHDNTYGITSDPLTQFACVFSALIHDADHTGVPNTQLNLENSTLAKVYKNKSVAEQNSVDLCWDLLMDSNFDELRAAIYSTVDERKRFRQLVVNSVMATDIMDKDLKVLRNSRWAKAFSDDARAHEESKENAVDRKATIVIEHLIQASDVSHTMQHWHIYRKWNARLFEELYRAFVDGRSDKDPSEFWYKGEMGFFDFYIIPLAKKLKDCGVFGVSSDEYLNYALKNRQEWEDRGLEVVASLVEDIQAKLLSEKKAAVVAPLSSSLPSL